MIELLYTNTFVKKVSKLNKDLTEKVFKMVDLFKNPLNHRKLKVHKLHGRFSDKHAFSVSYKIRIIFQYSEKNQAILLAVDDHDIYK